MELQSRKEGGRGEEAKNEGRRKRNSDLFIVSPNQQLTHWIAVTLISFCSTSSWAPLSSSHLFGIPNLAKQKFPPSHTRIKQWKRQFLNWGWCWGTAATPTASSCSSLQLRQPPSALQPHCEGNHLHLLYISSINEEVLRPVHNKVYAASGNCVLIN